MTDTDNKGPKLVRGDPNWREQAPNFVFRTLDDVREAGLLKEAETKTWESRRYITRKDGFGFSFHHTVLRAGQSTLIHYKNHVEAVLVFSGSGEIELCHPKQAEGDGFAVFKLEPGTFYGLGGQERHYLRASSEGDMHVACAFNPPVDGAEDHNEEGVYAAIGSDGVKRYEYDESAVPLLFQPPRTLRNGSKPRSASQTFPVVLTSNLTIRHPQKGDGKFMWSLAKMIGLDQHSPYLYHLASVFFADTCAVTIDNTTRDMVSFAVGFKPPSDLGTLFLWQMGVSPKYQNQNIAVSILDALTTEVRASYLQITIAKADTASVELIRKFAEHQRCSWTIENDWIADGDFPFDEPTKPKDLYTIGPLRLGQGS